MHYVYALYLGDALMYVGRSQQPKVRKVVHERKHACQLEQRIIYRSCMFERAAAREKKEIRERKPPWNSIVNSSCGMLGRKHTQQSREKMSVSKMMHPMSEEGRESLRRHNTNRPVLASTRAKLRKRFVGIPLSPEHRRKIGDAQRGSLNHMYGKKRSPEALRKTSEACKAAWKLRKQRKKETHGN